MDDDVQGGGDLAVDRLPAETRRASQRLQAGWHIGRGVGVQGAATSLMTGVQGTEEINDFGSPHLSDDKPVGAHPQGLTDEVAQADTARALKIGRARLQADDVRVKRSQLRRVFDEQQPLIGVGQGEQGGEQGRLAHIA